MTDLPEPTDRCAHCQHPEACKAEGACRREDALSRAGGTSDFTPRFGDKLRGIWAGEQNPQRDGFYVETTRHRSSRYHTSRYYRCTDGKGNFWEYPPDSVVLLEVAAAIRKEAL